jgi:hypothetical protein
VVHLGRFLHEELAGDRVRDEGVVTDFLAGHLPGRRCYRRPVGRREEPVRRGLAQLLVMLREEGSYPRSSRTSRPTTRARCAPVTSLVIESPIIARRALG